MLLVELKRRGLELRVHGDVGLSNQPLIADFGVNLNPFGPAPELLDAARNAELAAYPDATSARLRAVFASWLGGSAEDYLFAAGACPILWDAARLLHRTSGAPALIIGPTFSEYAAAVQATGASVFELRADPAADFGLDLEWIAKQARKLGVASLYLCNPNNPTGTILQHEEVTWLAELLAEQVLVLDESFLALSSGHRDLRMSLPNNVLRVRSLTKDYGLAGLRLGYATGERKLIRALENARAPWATSAPAQAAGLVIPTIEGRLCRDRARLVTCRNSLESELASRGFRVFPGAANFTLASHAVGFELPQALDERGIRVRDCMSFGLPGTIRFAARPEAERTLLLDSLDAVLPKLVQESSR